MVLRQRVGTGLVDLETYKIGSNNRSYTQEAKRINLTATLENANIATVVAGAYVEVFADRKKYRLSNGSLVETKTDLLLDTFYFLDNSSIDIEVDLDAPISNIVVGGYKYVYTAYLKFVVPSTIDEIEITNLEVHKRERTNLTSYSTTETAVYANYTLGLSAESAKLSSYFPKIKTIDFLTGLFKMFNLTAYYNGSQVVVMTLDNYYAAGNTYDITDYVDTTSTKVSKSVIYSDVDFSFEGQETFATSKANELTLNSYRDFGNEKLNNAHELFDEQFPFDGGKYEVKVPFEKMMYERMIDQESDLNTYHHWGWAVDSSESPMLCKPLLFYPEKVGLGYIVPSAYSLVFDKNVKMQDGSWNTIGGSWDSSGSSVSLINMYIRPSNSTDDDAYTLNFGAEIDEFSLDLNTNSLFDKFYKTYITSVYDKAARIYTFTAYLPSQILNRYELNDTFIIGNREYRINKIKVNLLNGKSELELINKL